jgi:hypothetical protein
VSDKTTESRAHIRSELEALAEGVTAALDDLKKARKRLKALRARLQALQEGVNQLSLLDETR